MPRKRIRLQTSIEKTECAIKLAKEKIKFRFSKNDLENLIWLMPHSKIAKLHKKFFGISINSHLVGDYCRKFKIEIPPLGYWSRKENINK